MFSASQFRESIALAASSIFAATVAIADETVEEIGGAAAADFNPVQTKRLADVTAPYLRDQPVAVFQETTTGGNALLQPYFGVFKEDFLKLQAKCSKLRKEDSLLNEIEFLVRLETSRPELRTLLSQRLASQDASKDNPPGVSRLPVHQIIVTADDGTVLIRFPDTLDPGIPTALSLDGTKDSVLPGKTVSCDVIDRIARTPRQMRARVVVTTDDATTDFEAITLQASLREELTAEIDRQESQIGKQLAESTSNMTSRQGAGGMSLGKVRIGASQQKLKATKVAAREDKRRRYVDNETLRAFVISANSRVSARAYCIRNETKSCTDMPTRLVNFLTQALETEQFQILRSDPEDEVFDNFVVIDDQGSIDEAFSIAAEPYASSIFTTEMPCGEAKDLVERAAKAKATGGASEAKEKPLSNKGAANSSTKGGRNCKNKDELTLKDKNNITWNFDGSEWIPTSVDVSYFSDDTISQMAAITMERTESTGQYFYAAMAIQTVLLKEQYPPLYSEMDVRLKKLEDQKPRLKRVHHSFWAFNSWSGGKDRRFFYYGTEPWETGFQYYAEYNGGTHQQSGGVVRKPQELAKNEWGVEIDLPSGYDANNTTCSFRGVNGSEAVGRGSIVSDDSVRHQVTQNYVYIKAYRGKYHIVALHQGHAAMTFAIDCFAASF